MSFSGGAMLGEDAHHAEGGGDVSKVVLQREGQEYDRRQIRRRMADRLAKKGFTMTEILVEDPAGAESSNHDEDNESVYDDTELYPWKQREAAVQAAAVGGRTEGRMEGFDSLERALQAHQHKLHYGRGRGFGWSSQAGADEDKKKRKTTILESRAAAQAENSLNNSSTDWTSFRNLDKQQEKQKQQQEAEEAAAVKQKADAGFVHHSYEQDSKLAKAQQRQHLILSTLYLLSALGILVGFAYYIETMKIDTYQTYLPKGYSVLNDESLRKASKSSVSMQTSASQQGFLVAAQQVEAVAAESSKQVADADRKQSRTFAKGRTVDAIGNADEESAAEEAEKKGRKRSGLFKKAEKAREQATQDAAAGRALQKQQQVVVDLDPSRREEILRLLSQQYLNNNMVAVIHTPAFQQALDWIAFQDDYQVSIDGGFELYQRFAVAWLGFGYGMELHGNSHECQWKTMVKCNRQGQIIQLNLAGATKHHYGSIIGEQEIQVLLPKLKTVKGIPKIRSSSMK